jgi:hypothetical protein
VTRNCSPARAPQQPVPFEEGPQQDRAQTRHPGPSAPRFLTVRSR